MEDCCMLSTLPCSALSVYTVFGTVSSCTSYSIFTLVSLIFPAIGMANDTLVSELHAHAHVVRATSEVVTWIMHARK